MKKKAQVMMYLYFIMIALTVVFITGVIAPLGVDFNSKLYVEGAKMIVRANTSISQITDTDARDRITASLSNAANAQEQNIEIGAGMFQYAWVFFLIIVGLAMFIWTRRLIEYNPGGFI